MKYSFYHLVDEDIHVYRLFIETSFGEVIGYEFKSTSQAISNEPGITRLFGKQIFDIAGNYFLYPLPTQNVETGEFEIIEKIEKYTKIMFLNKEKILNGEWILRWLSSGEILFWKPFPIVALMPTKRVEAITTDDSAGLQLEQQFSVFQAEADGRNSFAGIVAAEGVWTGRDLNTTLFTGKIIESIAKQMKDNIKDLVVDYNHSMVNEGVVLDVQLKEERGIKYIFVKGVGQRPVPHGSGLSLWLKSTIKWNSNLNVFVLSDAEAVGFGIMTENKPACTICMIR